MTKKVVSTRWRLPLPCAHPTAFSQISLFLNRFSREFWVSNKPYKSDSKNRRLEDSISDVLIMFIFFYRTMDAHAYGTILPFSREKVLKAMLKTDAERSNLASRTGFTHSTLLTINSTEECVRPFIWVHLASLTHYFVKCYCCIKST